MQSRGHVTLCSREYRRARRNYRPPRRDTEHPRFRPGPCPRSPISCSSRSIWDRRRRRRRCSLSRPALADSPAADYGRSDPRGTAEAVDPRRRTCRAKPRSRPDRAA